MNNAIRSKEALNNFQMLGTLGQVSYMQRSDFKMELSYFGCMENARAKFSAWLEKNQDKGRQFLADFAPLKMSK